MQRLLTIVAIGLGAILQAGAPAGSIEDYVASEMPRSGVPGLAYAVVADGEVTSVGAHGVSRMGSTREVTPDTPFLLGSISKSFTALAVMQLVEAGELGLDAQISQHLPSFVGKPTGAITIRQLLSHTSGFSTLQGNGSAASSRGGDSSGQDVLERRVDRLAEVTPAYGPDETWEYSNLNYEILGRLVEVVSGQEFQAYVAANILEPVGMENSFVADGETHEAMATGHPSWFSTKRPLVDNTTDRATAPQGGIVASARDVARYLQMMMSGKDDVLSAEGKALMMRPASTTSPLYGFGWFLDPGSASVWHAGASPGFETLAQMLPAEKKGVVVLVNGGSGVGFGETTQLRTGVAAIALGLDYNGEGSRWPQKALFVALMLLPLVYLASMVWAWRHRTDIRSKSGIPGLFSLWFPLLSTAAAAWVVLRLAPNLLGSPLATIRLFQPDFGLLLIATAVTGVLWALFRLGVAYTGRSGSA